MAEGTSTFMGRGVGLSGNYQIQGDNDTDDTLTITGASSSAAGDILVVQNSTGTEFLVVSSSGKLTLAGSYASAISAGLAISGSVAFTGGASLTVSSSAQKGLIVSVTSTGAIAAKSITPSGVVVMASSKSVIENVFLFDTVSNISAGDYVGTADFLLAVHGSKAPSYFLNVGVSSTFQEGAAANNGFFTAAARLTSSASISTITTFATIKVMSGSYVFCIPCYPNTMLT